MTLSKTQSTRRRRIRHKTSPDKRELHARGQQQEQISARAETETRRAPVLQGDVPARVTAHTCKSDMEGVTEPQRQVRGVAMP